MESIPSFNSRIEQSIINNWDLDAFTDYKGITLQYHDVARKIEKLHILFENSGIEKGDKIAICGRNCSSWAVVFLAVLTYGAVVVPIQNEFTSEQIHNIVNHSEARLLFTGDVVTNQINPDMMPGLAGIIYIPDYSVVLSRNEKLTFAREHLNEIFGNKYPKYFRKQHVHYYVNKEEELCMINYTSGTTGFSKGVMLPYRVMTNNVAGLTDVLVSKLPKHGNALSILPMAHMYGLTCEFLIQFMNGNHIFFLTRQPSPTLVAEACKEIKPSMLVSVPLVIEKIIRSKVYPLIQSNRIKLMMNMPVISAKIKERICQLTMDIFGGNLYEIIVGGAGMNHEVEAFLHDIGFPITMGYGTTETGPMITYSDKSDYVPGSCGTSFVNMEVKVNSADPANVPGEILTRGLDVMDGYYKNEQATKAVLDEDGWFHTGDLATMDESGHVFICGRLKNMLLSANGQNIYPEEIEDKLNSMPMVSESLIIQKNGKLIGLVHPDMEEANAMSFSDKDLEDIMSQNLSSLNAVLPRFCKVHTIKILDKEFEKTPKKSIKRYLYQDAI